MSERSIFLAALDIPDPVGRAAYLDRACGADPALRRGVEDLFAAHARSGTFMPEPAAAPTTRDYTPAEGPGARVGPYKLLEQIGEGGMGTVYMAEQTEPVRRTVAVKIIREGMDSKAVVARFDAERQALALMDHPNIAKVLDAGTTPTGRPYFVMELVKGVPITKFCDDHQLTLRERLGLFVPVCQAIQHAHQKGVIHRDVKPSNVLVALYDDHPVPKVIDFGVAKAAGQKLTDQTLFTAFGAVVGTLEYMSPEQAKLNQLDVDTRSDVYSLGVLLYELLTGSTPLTRQRLKSAALDEVLRLIREEEPERPSTRLSTAHTRPQMAAARKAEPGRLGQLLRGELDWIVLKALEKDRTRRYETANGLAKDVQRYLADEAVDACPPTVGYRVRKAYRKNRPVVWAAAAFVGLLAASVVTASVLAVQATKAERTAVAERRRAEEGEAEAKGQRDRAERERQRAEGEKRRAEEEKRAAEAVRRFLQADLLKQASVLEQANTRSLTGGDLEIKHNPTINELLDLAAAQLTPERVEVKFPSLPFVQAEVLHAVATAYAGIGEGSKALALIDRAVPLYLAARGPDDRATLAGRAAQAFTHLQFGRPAEGERMGAAVVADCRRVLGPRDRMGFEASVWHGRSMAMGGRAAEAIPFFQKLKAEGAEYYGASDTHSLIAAGHLAMAYRLAGQPAKAVREMEEVLASLRAVKVRPDHPWLYAAVGDLAEAYTATNRPDKAADVWRDMLDIWAARGEPYHQASWKIRHELALLHDHRGETEVAAKLFEENLKAAKTPNLVLYSYDGLVRMELRQGKDDDALAHARLGLDAVLAGQPPGFRSWQTGLARLLVGQALLKKDRAAAEPVLVAAFRDLVDSDDKRPEWDAKAKLSEAQRALTDLYTALGKPDEAKRLIALRLTSHEKVVRQFQERSPAESRESLEAVNALAHAYVAAGKTEPLVALFEQTLARLKEHGCPADDRSVTLTGEIGRALRLAGRPDLTRQMSAAVHESLARRTDVPPDVMARACFNLGYNLATDKRPADGVPLLRESLRLYREIDPAGWPATKSKIWLGTALLWDRKHDDAEKTLLDAYAEAVERRSQAPSWEKNYPERTAGRLATLYGVTGKPDEAAKWKALSEKK